MDVSTRIEEENRAGTSTKELPLPTLSDAESTDDELEGLSTFSIVQARKDLYDLPGCHMMMLKLQTQKLIGVEVGINVSQEFPWKRVRFNLLAEHLFDEIDNGEMLQEFFIKYKSDDRVLLGYAPSLIPQEENVAGVDPFVIYCTEGDARAAAAIIRNIETYERFMMNKNLIKRPRKWISKGSEYEVNLGLPSQKSEVEDVEIQSVYPMKQSLVKFTVRKTSDVRDGYVELVAGDTKFQNLSQQRVHVGVQSAPCRVTLEQQTDPTFPTNAWAQYFYEVKEDAEDGLDASTEEEEEAAKSATPSKAVTPETQDKKEPKSPPEMSEQIKNLLSVLEFNQIDLYRNDYPLISTAPIQIYTNPYLKEIFCFANIARSNRRYVATVDWYPTLTGIVVAAYAFSTKVTYNSVQSKEKVDEVQRAILEPNPILMWSFMDSLKFKLEFESPREVTSLSFCPYDENILIGGTMNGQIIIWDLQDRAKNLEHEEHLTIAQAANRELIADFLNWTIQYDEGTVVVPAAISILEHSQTAAITEIKWLSRKHYISSHGRIHETHLNAKSRYFCTLSFDGTIAYWNLDYDIGKAAKAAAKKFLPAALTQNESEFKKLNQYLKPEFMIAYPEPLTAMICDTANYTYTLQTDKKHSGSEIKTYPMLVEEVPPQVFRNSCIVGSLFGRIENLGFEGQDSGLIVNRENITTPTHSFARVHDGPIVALEKNPFYPEIFVSVGRTVMAIWKDDFPFTPILWRVRPKVLTAAKWSTDRPAVLFLTRNDGSFEAWDLLARDDNACLIEVLGGGIITLLSEHRAEVPQKVISIGDYNSSFRMVALPEGFYKPVPNELERLKAYVEKEVYRKTSIQSWQQNWREQNADIIEEKKRAEAEAAWDLERLRAEAEEAKKPKEAKTDKNVQGAPTNPAYSDPSEKLDKKFDELNYKRLMHNLMSRKKVDPEKLDRETALEKERLNFEARKKASIKAAISRVAEEIAAIRARLLPTEKDDVQLSDMIAGLVKRILQISPTYADVEKELQGLLDEAPPVPPIDYDLIIFRCRRRREHLNKVLGLPFTRVNFCKQQRLSGGLKDFDHGYGEFLLSLEEHLRERERDGTSVKTTHSDLDMFPEKETTSVGT